MNKNSTKKLVLAGLFIAIGLVLPFLTGKIPEFGRRLLPMHIPVLIAGFVLGWKYGLVVGFITPLLNSVLFTMPHMFPTAIAMALELAAYGCLTGLFYEIFPKNLVYTYATLILSMLGGRVVWGIVNIFLLGFGENAFTWQAFIAGGFINAIPGIILQIIIIPIIIIALERSNLIES